ncbi:hypothetical protein CA13_58960 [Planctomycetes bacterium CA13]|uniref:Thioredoxin-like fold domain-containing protein n=1 Tax=Novipirellula herctigrandis TaxID=2527986 RepID=A0A5C5ZB91_9BACT|nr:hypothetical protein CA13_58960 [Planctomycetes bacterium CA13]
MLTNVTKLLARWPRVWTSVAAIFFAVNISVAAGTRASTVQRAVSLAPDDGGMVAILLYGSDWNQTSEFYKSQVFDEPKVLSSLSRGAVLTNVDCKESPTPRDKVARESVNAFPDISIRTYPSIMILDGVGRAVIVLQPIQQLTDPSELGKLLEQWHQKLIARDVILAKARTASGFDQARQIGEAIRVLGVGLGPHVKDIRKHSFHEALTLMKAADPNDDTGWVFATEFPLDKVTALTNKVRETSGLEAAEAELDQRLQNQYLLPEQRQELQRQRFLLYKADDQPMEKQTEILELVSSEAPDTIIGRGAKHWAQYLREHSAKE